MRLLIVLQIVRVLAIGNSFSIDALEEQFVPVCREAGFTPVVGNLYIPSCTLEMHARNLRGDSANYSFRTWGIQGEKWDTTTTSIREALRAVDWDVISMQQGSHESGRMASYEPYLTILIDSVRKICPKAKLAWHETWTYPRHSTYRYFEQWGRDQKRMYDSILYCTVHALARHPEISLLIPTGTAIQNARRVYYKQHPDSTGVDPYCRDGLHLSHGKGRRIAAETWLKAIQGK